MYILKGIYNISITYVEYSITMVLNYSYLERSKLICVNLDQIFDKIIK